MAIEHYIVTVNNTNPTRVTPEGNESGVALSIQIQNLSSGSMYVGGEGLTSLSYGASIVPGGVLAVDRLSRKDELYVLSQEATGQVAILMVQR